MNVVWGQAGCWDVHTPPAWHWGWGINPCLGACDGELSTNELCCYCPFSQNPPVKPHCPITTSVPLSYHQAYFFLMVCICCFFFFNSPSKEENIFVWFPRRLIQLLFQSIIPLGPSCWTACCLWGVNKRFDLWRGCKETCNLFVKCSNKGCMGFYLLSAPRPLLRDGGTQNDLQNGKGMEPAVPNIRNPRMFLG